MKTDEKEKYYLSYIKSAHSTVALTLLLNLIFIIRNTVLVFFTVF